jgi:iron(III) transport system substrate-binding protein
MPHQLSRRDLLKTAAALPLVYATPMRAAPPSAETITPALVAAATKEGQVTWYTSADLQLAEKVGKAFEQNFPGIRARVERAGGERIFARVAQEYASGLHIADAVSTGDAAQFSLEAPKLACALCAGGCRETHPAGSPRS